MSYELGNIKRVEQLGNLSAGPSEVWAYGGRSGVGRPSAADIRTGNLKRTRVFGRIVWVPPRRLKGSTVIKTVAKVAAIPAALILAPHAIPFLVKGAVGAGRLIGRGKLPPGFIGPPMPKKPGFLSRLFQFGRAVTAPPGTPPFAETPGATPPGVPSVPSIPEGPSIQTGMPAPSNGGGGAGAAPAPEEQAPEEAGAGKPKPGINPLILYGLGAFVLYSAFSKPRVRRSYV